MPTISAQLNRIIDRSTKIIDLCVTLQEENDLLKLENQSLKVAVDASSQKVRELEEKVKTLAVARSLEGMTESAELLNEKNLGIKQKIDDFVREIDKCILLLK
jgi:regulator of replication initiation timing